MQFREAHYLVDNHLVGKVSDCITVSWVSIEDFLLTFFTKDGEFDEVDNSGFFWVGKKGGTRADSGADGSSP